MAKRFQFRLETLHKHRQRETDSAKRAFGEVAQMRMAKEREIDGRTGYLNALLTAPPKGKVHELQAYSSHIAAVREHIEVLKAELANIAEIEAMRRNELTRTMRDENVLDTLRDKHVEQHRQALLAEEQATLDEIALRSKPLLSGM
ncbi:MAG: flagellar FliJ family protein [Candidatus Kapabacteria bacterium]|nr:flagellar FliJ family protein [Candidatus Kapabacteria bacterium]